MKSETTKQSEAEDKALITEVRECMARWQHAMKGSPTKSVALFDAMDYLEKLIARLEDQEPLCPDCDAERICRRCGR